MKTTNFDVLLLEVQEDGSVLLLLKDISQEEFEVSLTADELHMFQVEIGNALHDARAVELERRKEHDIEREARRGA